MAAMKVLTATKGELDTDFHHTVAGELVYLGLVCSRDERDPDAPDACGCGRAFVGANSQKATTTAEVTDVEMGRSDVATAVAASMHQGGWTAQEDPTAVEEIVEEMLEIADTYPVGAVLRRRLDTIEW
jgi:hypothetical protein